MKTFLCLLMFPVISFSQASVPKTDFPIVDYHVHLKGDLSLEKAVEISKAKGVKFGILPNCGIGFPITDDAGIDAFINSMKGQPFYLGMQAEGREWVNIFSKEAIAKFDYVISDALTFLDDKGRRNRIWLAEETFVEDKQEFMDLIVRRTLSILNNEPIDIWANPTFLPEQMQPEYDALWTKERMDKVIHAAVKNNIAIEINARYRIPSIAFLKAAKRAGAKFSFGTNNIDSHVGELEYCYEALKELGLTKKDMFVPKL